MATARHGRGFCRGADSLSADALRHDLRHLAPRAGGGRCVRGRHDARGSACAGTVALAAVLLRQQLLRLLAARPRAVDAVTRAIQIIAGLVLVAVAVNVIRG